MGKTNLTLNEALDVFKENQNDIRRACVSNIQWIQAQYPEAKEPDYDNDSFTAENIMQHIDFLMVEKRCEPYERTIRRIDARKRKSKPGQITEADIEAAREYPIQELFLQLTGEKPKKGMAQCPFHPDSTASFSMRRYNRYRCFGCDERGDTIQLVMKIEGRDFISAVKELCNTR